MMQSDLPFQVSTRPWVDLSERERDFFCFQDDYLPLPAGRAARGSGPAASTTKIGSSSAATKAPRQGSTPREDVIRLCYTLPMSTRTAPAVRYVHDEEGNLTEVVVPAEVWQRIASLVADKYPDIDDDLAALDAQQVGERNDTEYLMSSPAMHRELLESMATPPDQFIPLHEVLARLGISEDDLK